MLLSYSHGPRFLRVVVIKESQTSTETLQHEGVEETWSTAGSTQCNWATYDQIFACLV